MPPKPSMKPQPGSFRSKPGIGLVGHSLSTCCVLSTVPNLVGGSESEAQAFPLRMPRSQTASALVLEGKRSRVYREE